MGYAFIFQDLPYDLVVDFPWTSLDLIIRVEKVDENNLLMQ